VEILARDEAPWPTVEGMELRSVTVAASMCRSLVSVGWDARLYDCDFNQMLEIQLGASAGRRRTVWTLDSLEALEGARVASADHCYGCTAGAGSSSGGALQ
jgi:hypothetical protein